MNLAASLFPLLIWLAYAVLVERFERVRPSLSSLMNKQRHRWVANAAHRDSPLDAILSSNLMGSVSFFASTTVLLILALFAVFGQMSALTKTVTDLRPDLAITGRDIEIHIVAALAMFVAAFLSFTLSLRQFNHFCIMIGAVDHTLKSNSAEITTIAALNSMGARNFNQGIRAYYFAIPMLIWFAGPPLAIVATLVILAWLIHREFFSSARKLVAGLKTK